MASDGKAQRGRLAFATTAGGTARALTAYSHEAGIALAQREIRSTADKVEVELTVARALLARLDWRGCVMTGDARFCQRHLCAQVRAARGDYLLLAKEHQPTLYAALDLLFDPPADGPQPLPLLERHEVVTREKGHGRTHDRRHLLTTTDLTGRGLTLGEILRRRVALPGGGLPPPARLRRAERRPEALQVSGDGADEGAVNPLLDGSVRRPPFVILTRATATGCPTGAPRRRLWRNRAGGREARLSGNPPTRRRGRRS